MTLWMITKPLGKILVSMYPSIILGEPLQYQLLPLSLWLLTANEMNECSFYSPFQPDLWTFIAIKRQLVSSQSQAIRTVALSSLFYYVQPISVEKNTQ